MAFVTFDELVQDVHAVCPGEVVMLLPGHSKQFESTSYFPLGQAKHCVAPFVT